LFISVRTPITDAIHGLGLGQEFDLELEATGSTTFGRLKNVIERHVVST
jgi:hypothetical protein